MVTRQGGIDSMVGEMLPCHDDVARGIVSTAITKPTPGQLDVHHYHGDHRFPIADLRDYYHRNGDTTIAVYPYKEWLDRAIQLGLDPSLAAFLHQQSVSGQSFRFVPLRKGGF